MSMNGITSVYQPRHGEGYEWLLPVDSNDYDLLRFGGKARGSSWKPVRVYRTAADVGLPQLACDLPCWGGHGLAMTEAAKTKIGPLLERYGEFLPLSCDDGHFWVFHVTHFVDALDEDASELERASDDPNRIIGIRRHVFRPERFAGDLIFQLPQFRCHDYVTDPFVNMIRDSGLTGLACKRVWPHS